MTINQLRDLRAKHIADARGILTKAQTEQRELTTDERVEYDRLFAEAAKVKDQIADLERGEQLEQIERELAAPAERRTASERPDGAPAPRSFEYRGQAIAIDAGHPLTAQATDEYRAAFRRYLLHGDRGLAAEHYRSLSAGSNVEGGYTVPVETAMRLIQAVDDLCWIRQLGTVIPSVDGKSLGFPSLDTDPASPAWTTELAIGTEDSSMAFGKRELSPHPLAKLLKVSEKLLRASAIDIESLVMARMAYKRAVTQENAFLNGTGASQPLGMFVASSQGISTSRDVSTGNTTTAIGADNLRETKYKVAAQYRASPSCGWVLHRDAVKAISKLKDGEGQYLWQPGLVGNDPDRLLGSPVHESEYAPNTFTTGLYVGVFGDLKQYWIADSLAGRIQRLVELYAATAQVGFIDRSECDGMPVLEAAFARMKLA